MTVISAINSHRTSLSRSRSKPMTISIGPHSLRVLCINCKCHLSGSLSTLLLERSLCFAFQNMQRLEVYTNLLNCAGTLVKTAINCETSCWMGDTLCSGVVNCCNPLRKVELRSTLCNASCNKKVARQPMLHYAILQQLVSHLDVQVFPISNQTSIKLQRKFVSVKMLEYSWVAKFLLKFHRTIIRQQRAEILRFILCFFIPLLYILFLSFSTMKTSEM